MLSQLEVKWNLEIVGFDRGKRRVLHQRTHNIIVANGRQFILEAISASAFNGQTFMRMRSDVVRYIGVGIGGNRQAVPEARQAPLSSTYPAGYGGTNDQTDVDLTVSRLERPVKATPALWMKQVAAPPAFSSPTRGTWSALFDAPDVNIGSFVTVPISEIGLFTSAADPALPNGGGAYPGGSTAMIAYDTFTSLPKTGYWSFVVNWTWQI